MALNLLGSLKSAFSNISSALKVQPKPVTPVTSAIMNIAKSPTIAKPPVSTVSFAKPTVPVPTFAPGNAKPQPVLGPVDPRTAPAAYGAVGAITKQNTAPVPFVGATPAPAINIPKPVVAPPKVATPTAVNPNALAKPAVYTPGISAQPTSYVPPTVTAPPRPPAVQPPPPVQTPAPVVAPAARAMPVTSDGYQINAATGGVKAPAMPDSRSLPLGSPEGMRPGANTDVSMATAPSMPTVNQDMYAGVDTASKAYEESLRLSPEEMAAQAEADRLAESASRGYQNTAEQTIPLEFIVGQQKAIEQRALNLNEPIQRRLARLQAERLARTEAAKFGLEREQGKVDFARAAANRAEEMGIARSDTEYERNFEQQKFDEDKRRFGLEYALAQQKAGETTAGEDFTLGEGQTRYDANGNVIAGGGTAPGGGANTQGSLDQLAFLKSTANQAEALSDASGASGITRFFGDMLKGDTKYRQLETLTNTLRTNVLTLMTDPAIKKFFGPQMTEADVRLMTSAATTLNPEGNSPAQIKAEIVRLREMFNRMETSVKGGGGGDGNYDDLDAALDKAGFKQGSGGTPKATGMRTDRHNNPTAFTTDIAKLAGLKEGVDYAAGDSFSNGQYKTARLLKDPIGTTIKVIDKIGFYTQSGKPRWDYIAMPQSQWQGMSNAQKSQVIQKMYKREGGTQLAGLFNARA